MIEAQRTQIALVCQRRALGHRAPGGAELISFVFPSVRRQICPQWASAF